MTSAKPAILIPFFLAALLSTNVQAQVEWDGFVRNYNAITTTDGDYLIGRNRFELNLSKPLSNGRIYVSTQFLNPYSDSLEQIDARIREAYFEMYFDNVDLRVGKQLIPYGQSIGFFITDILNPFDISEFLTQEPRDIRLGITALKATYYIGPNSIELVAAPNFTSYRLPQLNSPFFPFQNITDITSLPLNFSNSLDQVTINDAQISLKASFRNNLKYDFDVFLMYWYNPNPIFGKDFVIDLSNILAPEARVDIDARYLQTLVAGFSSTYIVSDRVLLKTEHAYFAQRYFDLIDGNLRALLNFQPSLEIFQLIDEALAVLNNQNGFVAKKPLLNSMVGTQLALGSWTIENQWVSEYIFDYQDEILQDEWFVAATILAQKQFFRDKLRYTQIARYNLNGRDYWINPEFAYEVMDGVEAIGGFQWFGGANRNDLYGHFSFDSYGNTSFGYLKLTAFF